MNIDALKIAVKTPPHELDAYLAEALYDAARLMLASSPTSAMEMAMVGEPKTSELGPTREEAIQAACNSCGYQEPCIFPECACTVHPAIVDAVLSLFGRKP